MGDADESGELSAGGPCIVDNPRTTGNFIEMTSAPSAPTVREQIADRVRADIATGRYEPGAPLREVALARAFNVSRGPIRDALLQLTQEGLLVAKPNCGVRVAPLVREATARLLVETRRNIETHALRHGFERIDDPVLAELRRNLDAFGAACAAERMDEVVRLDMAFHRTIVSLLDEDHLMAVWVPVVSRMLLPYSRHANLLESRDEHEAILRAIADGDVDRAARALEQNIQ